MKVPSLRQIALESVADYIENGHYDNVDYSLSPPLSNEIFSIFSRNEPLSKNLLEQIGSKFTLTRAVLEDSSVDIVQNQKLEFLVFEGSSQNLENSLTEKSTRHLKHLELKNDKRIPWMITAPNLETLILGNTSQAQIQHIFRNFHCLRTLEIDAICVKNLDVIGELTNLEVLSVWNPIFLKTWESIIPIFYCKKLKVLDLSRDSDYSEELIECNIIENYLKCDRVLPELQFFDCRWTDLDEEKLEALMKRHKNLKQVVALNTPLDHITLTGIELLNRATPHSFMKCFQHYLSIRRVSTIEYLLEELNLNIHQYWNENDDNEAIMVDLLRLICRAMKIFGSEINVFSGGVKCLEKIVGLFTPIRARCSLPSADILPIIDQLIISGTRWITVQSDAFGYLFSILWCLPLPFMTLPPQISRRLITFGVEYLKTGAYRFPRFLNLMENLIQILCEKLDSKNLIAMWPRSDVWVPLVCWLNSFPLEAYYDRVESILAHANMCRESLIQKLVAEDVRNCVVIFWNRENWTPEFINRIRSELPKYPQHHLSLTQYMLTKMTEPIDKKRALVATEILSTLITLSQKTTQENRKEFWQHADQVLKRYSRESQKTTNLKVSKWKGSVRK